MGKHPRSHHDKALYYSDLPFGKHNKVSPRVVSSHGDAFSLFATTVVAPAVDHVEELTGTGTATVAVAASAQLPSFQVPTPSTGTAPAVIRPMAQAPVGAHLGLGAQR